MRPQNLNSRILLDSGDPLDTRKTLEMLGFLDGQTTNPSLISKNPKIQERIKLGNKYLKEEIFSMYKEIVQEISSIIPSGDISIEVYSDLKTTAEEMIEQAEKMNFWVKNGRIKLPTTKEGLKAAALLAEEGIKLNMTLCFSQMQAAGIYSATLGSKFPLFVSPFIGRLDDIGKEGIDLIRNILKMFHNSDKHVEVLAASIRDLDHFMYTLYLKSDLLTVPLNVLVEWYKSGMKIPDRKVDKEFIDQDDYFTKKFDRINYEEIDLNRELIVYDIFHELTEKGVDKFAKDWNDLII